MVFFVLSLIFSWMLPVESRWALTTARSRILNSLWAFRYFNCLSKLLERNKLVGNRRPRLPITFSSVGMVKNSKNTKWKGDLVNLDLKFHWYLLLVSMVEVVMVSFHRRRIICIHHLMYRCSFTPQDNCKVNLRFISAQICKREFNSFITYVKIT